MTSVRPRRPRQDRLPAGGRGSNRKGQYTNVSDRAPDASTIVFRLKWPQPSFLASLASPYNWVYKAEILARTCAGTRRTSWEPPLRVCPSTSRARTGRQEEHQLLGQGKPYLDGYRAIFMKDSAAQVAAIARSARHIQFRGFSPASGDSSVNALGRKITVQEARGTAQPGWR